MARIRTIKPEFPQSETVGNLSRDARLLFIQLWTLVDDEGRARGASRMLASLLYPYDEDAPSLIEGWLTELEREECVRRYFVQGSIYIEMTNWLKHQKIDKPSKSKIPPFDDASRMISTPREVSATDLGPRTWTLDQERDHAALNAGAAAQSKIDLRHLENQLRSAARFEESPSPALLDLSPILGLIDAGLDFETEILPVVRSKARPGIGSWNFFVKACHDSRASRNAAANAHGHASARAPPKQTEKRNLPFAIYEEMSQDERDSRGQTSIFTESD